MAWYLWVSTVRGDSASARGNFLHGPPLCDERDDLTLAGRQCARGGASPFRQRREDVGCEIRREVPPAPKHRVDGGDQLLPGRVLHDEPGCPGTERLGRELGVGVHGQEDHLGGNRFRLEPAQRLEPAHAGHGHVGHDDVGSELPRGLDQPGPVGHGPDEGELASREGSRVPP